MPPELISHLLFIVFVELVVVLGIHSKETDIFTMHSELSSEQYVQTTDRTNVETTTDNGDGTKTIEFNSTIETRTDDTSQEDIMLYRHYKKYEKERFLRWYGTDHVPQFDLNSLTKQTICQSPVLKNDANSENFYADARNLIDVNLDRLNQDESSLRR